MRFAKAFLVGVTGLFIFITLLSLLITSRPKVSRTVFVNTGSKEKLMAQVGDFANWKNWHPVFKPGSAKVSFGKTTAGVGGNCEIVYNNKATKLAITKVDSNAISFNIKQDGENDISNQIFITSMQQTRVDWVATTHLHWYPWEKFYAIFIDKLTGPGYETALNGLKQFAESH